MNTEELNKDNTTGHNHKGPNANRPLTYLTATSIISDNIENAKGEKIGGIKDIMVNIRTGQIDYVIVEFGGFLGMGEKYFAVPFSALRVNTVNETFILAIDKKVIEEAPGFDKNHWPKTNGHYEEATGYWGGFMGQNTGA